ncbi:hypothetical protein K3495_g8892 [Podosphaera aphanis]|nr:hypothetical protein K3495_g8892 [Podosphaera aphanis]
MASHCAISEENMDVTVSHSTDPSSAADVLKRSRSTSNSNRFNTGRYEKGEPSKSRHLNESAGTAEIVKKGGSTTNTSHYNSEHSVHDEDERNKRPRSSNNGGFLLSSTIFERSFKHRHTSHERQKSRQTKVIPKNLAKKYSNGSQMEENPPATKKESMEFENTKVTQATAVIEPIKQEFRETPNTPPNNSSVPLDTDSAHIVNLALNLSENRRNASRRVYSIPQISGGMVESLGGGSLRQHLQNQRRIPRVIPPNSNQTSHSIPALLRPSQRASSPLSVMFNTQEAQAYQYNFSSSTLARAEKARITIELMAQYRRLLHFVPPLKSNTSEKIQLGREYNPLQYIRNRKLRARISKSIDGEAQGFGGLEKVTNWVDDVAKVASFCEFQYTQDFFLPRFEGDLNDEASPTIVSPRSNSGMTPARVKRPRVDWIINPADLIADLYWLEKDHNKKLIEDRDGNTIYPSNKFTNLTPQDVQDKEAHLETFSSSPKQVFDIQMESNFPETRSSQYDPQRISESATSKARQKLRVVRDATINHGSDHRSRGRFRSRSTSSSLSLSSDMGHRRRSRGRISEDFQDHAKNLLEKQILEMIAREEKEKELALEGDKIMQSIESQKLLLNPSLKSQCHSRSSTMTSGDLKYYGLPSRPSNEIHGFVPQNLTDWRDTTSESTAPNSPQIRVAALRNSATQDVHNNNLAAVSSSALTQRSTSVVRKSIQPFQAHNHDPKIVDESKGKEKNRHRSISIARRALITSVDKRKENSLSPKKLTMERIGLDNSRVGNDIVSTGRLKVEGERLSSIRGFLRSPRNPVVRVSDFLWKKDSMLGTSSNAQVDNSDSEELPFHQHESESLRIIHGKNERRSSRENSTGASLEEKESLAQQDASLRLKNRSMLATPLECETEASHAPQNASQLMKHNLPRIDVQPAPSTEQYESLRNDQNTSGSSSNYDFKSPIVLEADASLENALDVPDRRQNTLPFIRDSSPYKNSSSKNKETKHRHPWVCDGRLALGSDVLTKREVARLRVILLGSGMRAREIQRRITTSKDVSSKGPLANADHLPLSNGSVAQDLSIEQYRCAARNISEEIQHSSLTWKATSDKFTQTSAEVLGGRITNLQSRLTESLTLMTRTATDEAEVVSRDLVMDYSLEVTHVADRITQIMRRRGARFRWLRRKGWAVLEWALIGIMWWVWFIVMIVRVFSGLVKGVIRVIKWMLWL